MIHLGDITKISGYDAPIVDCVIGGSPCQDLSVAGKRAGLAGKRSGLYMEQIRIIKEMREHDRLSGRTGVLIRPRYMVWENVPGAFSSNGGKDFAAVLEEAIRIAEPEAPDVPVPPKGWPTSGCIRGVDGRWSIAWRVLDAQFWGVPQRRRRIALVADFGGDSASEILFVREGVRGYLEESEPKRKEAAGDAGASVGVHNPDRAAGCDIYNLAVTGDTVCSLTAQGYGSTGTCPKVIAPDKSATLSTLQDQTLFQPVGKYWDGTQVAGTLTANNAGGNQRMPDKENFNCVIQPICMATQQGGAEVRTDDKAPTLTAAAGMSGNNQPVVCLPHPTAYSIENHPADSRVSIDESGEVQTLTSRMRTGGGNVPMIMEPFCKSARPKFADDATVWKSCKIANTLNTFDLGETRVNELVVTEMADKENPVYCLQGNGIDRADTASCNGKGWNDKTCYTLNTIDRPAVAYGVEVFHCNHEAEKVPKLKARDWKDPNVVAYANTGTRYIVRRLTPLECERLQGFPDGWTDIGEWVDSNGKKHKDADSPRYKALGNSIAIPPWKWVLKRICACYERDATMASLFDGIGGFPYIWEQINGKGSCLWASEIEEFPMAVTRMRFGGAE